MPNAKLVLDPSFVTAPVDSRLFGTFVEHMGRCVYPGIYEPGHPRANGDGFRTDVLELLRELGVTVVRYPGGNFVSGYRWEDGVDPVGQRPTRLEPAWRVVESNAFGLGQYMRWAAQADIEPMLAINLGTRGLQEALDLLADLRNSRSHCRAPPTKPTSTAPCLSSMRPPRTTLRRVKSRSSR